MGIFTTGLIGDLAKGVFGIVDDLHMSGEEKADAKFRISQLAAAADIAQIEVNKQEAKSGMLFVSGWRPFIGWTCGVSLAWTFILAPIIQSVATYVATFTGKVIDLEALPVLDLAVMMPILLGMLGLGTLRTYEKVQGVERTALTDVAVKAADKLRRGRKRDGT